MGNDSFFAGKGKKRQELGYDAAGTVMGAVAQLVQHKRNLVGAVMFTQVDTQSAQHNLPSQYHSMSSQQQHLPTLSYDLTDK